MGISNFECVAEPGRIKTTMTCRIFVDYKTFFFFETIPKINIRLIRRIWIFGIWKENPSLIAEFHKTDSDMWGQPRDKKLHRFIDIDVIF